MMIAIDGPAGAGKSTLARAVAAALGFTYLDTGAMYRAVALRAAQTGRPAPEIAKNLKLELGERVRVDGEDVTEAIRTPAISAAASQVAADPAVRAAMVALQRQLIEAGDWVAEGRDIGTVVAPDAELKIFLTASPEVRAGRRAGERGTSETSAVLAEQLERDERDSTRAHSPLTAAPDAVVIDSSELGLDAVVARVTGLARSYLSE
jgi:cytidylate kinase